MLFVTHDFGVVAQLCDDICVMYAGQTVEAGKVRRDPRRAVASLHAGAAGLPSRPRDVAHRHSRPGAVALSAAARLPLRAALPRCAAGLPAQAPPPQGRARSGVDVRCVQYA